MTADTRREIARQIEMNGRAMSEAFHGLQGTSIAALDELLARLHACSPEACAHARRVAAMAVRLARSLGVAEPELTHIARGALLHDIGKLALPSALLCRPEPLTEQDAIAILRTHAEVAHDIIAAAPALRDAARIVLHSHEAWDGTGYPDGLAGPDIPLGSRIAAVVDTYDALTWGSPRRDAVSVARVAADLVRCSGSLFDPDVVRSWLRVADGLEAQAV